MCAWSPPAQAAKPSGTPSYVPKSDGRGGPASVPTAAERSAVTPRRGSPPGPTTRPNRVGPQSALVPHSREAHRVRGPLCPSWDARNVRRGARAHPPPLSPRPSRGVTRPRLLAGPRVSSRSRGALSERTDTAVMGQPLASAWPGSIPANDWRRRPRMAAAIARLVTGPFRRGPMLSKKADLPRLLLWQRGSCHAGAGGPGGAFPEGNGDEEICPFPRGVHSVRAIRSRSTTLPVQYPGWIHGALVRS